MAESADPSHPDPGQAEANTDRANDHDTDYAALLAAVTRTFQGAVGEPTVGWGGAGPLFATNAADLFRRYIERIPAAGRQTHSCAACRRFIDTFGGLVTLDADGRARPALWDAEAVPAYYRPAVAAMQEEVSRARVTGPFLSPLAVYGRPEAGGWTHLSATPPATAVYSHALWTAGQAMAARREDFRTVTTALNDFKPAALTQALRLLEADALARSERFVAPVRWLLDLHVARSKATSRDTRVRENVLWRAIATAPTGYCHPRASVTGSLLEDLAAGLPFTEVKRRFDAKLHPLQYQRPQAAPSEGAIAAAEKMVEQLGLAPSLERRWARLDEIETLWRPQADAAGGADASDGARAGPPATGGGVFAHLRPKGAAARTVGGGDMPAVTMTWDKFARTVLPDATAMQVMVPEHGGFIGMTTAANANAPPIIRWDRPERRNPFAWYVYHNGSKAAQWGLKPGWAGVAALTASPSEWGDDPKAYLSNGLVIVVEGAQDTRNESACLFPEFLRGELHGIRSVVEAYSRRAKLGQAGGPAASGLYLGKSKGQAGHRLRVTGPRGVTEYLIDRWD